MQDTRAHISSFHFILTPSVSQMMKLRLEEVKDLPRSPNQWVVEGLGLKARSSDTLSRAPKLTLGHQGSYLQTDLWQQVSGKPMGTGH